MLDLEANRVTQLNWFLTDNNPNRGLLTSKIVVMIKNNRGKNKRSMKLVRNKPAALMYSSERHRAVDRSQTRSSNLHKGGL